MDTILNLYFEMFDSLIEKSNDEMTKKIEAEIDETKEILKKTFEIYPSSYAKACLYIDKKFDEYILQKQE